MSKFKVGDKVKRVLCVKSFTDVFNKDSGEVTGSSNIGCLTINNNEEWVWDSKYFELIQDKWTIYNNNQPLSELSDEQRGLLFNHRCNGGDIETESSSGWRVINNPQWIVTSTYRAKQKTERELFIDEWSSKITTNEYNGGNVHSLVGQMFDDVNGK